MGDFPANHVCLPEGNHIQYTLPSLKVRSVRYQLLTEKRDASWSQIYMALTMQIDSSILFGPSALRFAHQLHHCSAGSWSPRFTSPRFSTISWNQTKQCIELDIPGLPTVYNPFFHLNHFFLLSNFLHTDPVKLLVSDVLSRLFEACVRHIHSHAERLGALKRSTERMRSGIHGHLIGIKPTVSWASNGIYRMDMRCPTFWCWPKRVFRTTSETSLFFRKMIQNHWQNQG